VVSHVTPLLGKLPFGGAAVAGDKRKKPFFCFWPFPLFFSLAC